MKMRRTLAAMMSGILAMSPAGVIFADEAAQTPVTYGDMISHSHFLIHLLQQRAKL